MKYLKVFEKFDGDKYEWREYFEILSFKYDLGDGDFKLIDKNHPEYNDCIEDCIENVHTEDPIEIYSVKRICDGEIFTLGGHLYMTDMEFPYQHVSNQPLSEDYGTITKIWPSFGQMRADVGKPVSAGYAGQVLNHTFFKSNP